MNKSLRLLAAGVAAAIALTGCSSSDNSDSLEQVKSQGKLRIGLTGDFMPNAYHDETGKLVGYEVEVGEQVAKDLGVEPEFIETRWDSLIGGLDVDKFDVIINDTNPTEERKAKYDFTKPYAGNLMEILTTPDSGIKGLSDIKGKKCAQVASSDYYKVAEDAGAEIVVTQGSGAPELLENRQAECNVASLVGVETYLKTKPESKLVAVSVPEVEAVDIPIMLPKNKDSLKEALNESIEKRVADGTFKQTYEKYIGKDISPK